LFRLTECSERLPQATRRQLIQNKIKDIGASAMVTEDEYLDLIQLQDGDESNSSTNRKTPSEEKQAPSSVNFGEHLLHFEKYSLDDLQLKETEGEGVAFNIICILFMYI
jgi:hypothetical protein